MILNFRKEKDSSAPPLHLNLRLNHEGFEFNQKRGRQSQLQNQMACTAEQRRIPFFTVKSQKGKLACLS